MRKRWSSWIEEIFIVDKQCKDCWKHFFHWNIVYVNPDLKETYCDECSPEWLYRHEYNKDMSYNVFMKVEEWKKEATIKKLNKLYWYE